MKTKKTAFAALMWGVSLTTGAICILATILFFGLGEPAPAEADFYGEYGTGPAFVGLSYTDSGAGVIPVKYQPDDTGTTFTSKLCYTANKLSGPPNTFEAWIMLPKTQPASVRGGVITGNYSSSGKSCVSFEIYTNYNPRLYWNNAGSVFNYVFSEVSVPLGKWTHLAVVRDEASDSVCCYLNGVPAQTLALGGGKSFALERALGIGGDMRSGNAQYFKGAICEAAVFYDARSAAEISADYNSVNGADPDLFGHWIMKDAGSAGLDASGRGNHIVGLSDGVDRPDGGLAPAADASLVTSKPLGAMPCAFEAVIYLPKTLSALERGGVIIGNYGDSSHVINFEVYTDFIPRLYCADADLGVADIKFDGVSLPVGEWVHLAVVRESGNRVVCYINGEPKQTETLSARDLVCTSPHVVGGDLRSGNTQYFKGNIMSVAVYSDSRSAAEVAAAYAGGVDIADKNLLGYWDFSTYPGKGNIEDKSSCGNTLIKKTKWFAAEPTDPDTYDYTFAVIGDTQILAERYPDKLMTMYRWIADNAVSRKIKYVMGLGDITNGNTEAEWKAAQAAITLLDGVVPYSLVIGNHDYSSGKNPLNPNKYFPYGKYSRVEWFGGAYEEGTIDNIYYKFRAGRNDYLVLVLEYGPTDAVLEWAGGVIEAHPEHNVIITTHCYLFRDGTTLDAGDVVPPKNKFPDANNGDGIWEKLASRYENVVLVISGHDPCDDVVISTQTGAKSNVVTQILCNPQGLDASLGATGLVLLLHFSDGGRTVRTEYYSTARDEYFLETNQTSFSLNVVGKTDADSTETETQHEADPATGDNTRTDETEETDSKITEQGCRSIASLPPVVMAGLPAGALMVRKKRRKT